LSNSLQSAGGVGGLLSIKENENIRAYIFDGNGNTSEILAGGLVVAHYEYDPFGNTITALGVHATANAWRFSTKPFDTVSSLYYYGYRFYNSNLGRWQNRDPIEEKGGWNLYAILMNDCMNDFDYLGNLSLQKCLQRAREMRPHIDELRDHYSPNHCNALRGLLSRFMDGSCKQWANNSEIAQWLRAAREIYNQRCNPDGKREKRTNSVSQCVNGQCVFVNKGNAKSWLVITGAVALGAAIIVFDVVTIPSGEGLCGVALITWAFAN
jgi:RHS repeat-associated protein